LRKLLLKRYVYNSLIAQNIRAKTHFILHSLKFTLTQSWYLVYSNMRSLLAGFGLLSLAAAAPTAPPSKYIVVMKKGSQASVESLLKGDNLQGVPVHAKYEFGTFKGLAATLNEKQIATLKSNKHVSAHLQFSRDF
jgi:hypothetical protein